MYVWVLYNLDVVKFGKNILNMFSLKNKLYSFSTGNFKETPI